MIRGFVRYPIAAHWVRAEAAKPGAGRTDLAVALMLGALLLLDWLVFVAVLFGLIGGWFDA